MGYAGQTGGTAPAIENTDPRMWTEILIQAQVADPREPRKVSWTDLLDAAAGSTCEFSDDDEEMRGGSR